MTDHLPRINGETYFFRDQGQFDLLRRRILPQLIARHRADKHLRLWSAGCSSGEEVYSLAILIDQILPDRSDWNIEIIGSDIDQTALTKARNARYGQWSFRMTEPELLKRYFRKQDGEWLLDEAICRMVTFRTLDLIRDPYPDDIICRLDLILCRNVFIYFDESDIRSVAIKQAASLCDGGYLLSGHTELIGHHGATLRSRLFAEGVIYQRVTLPSKEAELQLPIIQSPKSEPLVSISSPANLPSALPPTSSVVSLLTAAHQHADRGAYAQAEQACLDAINLDPLAAGPHFLLAQLAQLHGDFAQAEELLNKTLYLDSHFVAAYLELAALHTRAGRSAQAQTLRRIALDVLDRLPGDTTIAAYETNAVDMKQRLALQVHDEIHPG